MAPSAPSDALRLQRATAADLAELNALILRSKAYWGYDADMMAIMAGVLKLDPEAVIAGRVLAAWSGTRAVGVVQVSQPYDTPGGRAQELDLLFIASEMIGSGLGRRLYAWALDQARAHECSRLDILSDPNARPFYVAMGARFVEERPSETVPGRWLPWLEHRLTAPTTS